MAICFANPLKVTKSVLTLALEDDGTREMPTGPPLKKAEASLSVDGVFVTVRPLPELELVAVAAELEDDVLEAENAVPVLLLIAATATPVDEFVAWIVGFAPTAVAVIVFPVPVLLISKVSLELAEVLEIARPEPVFEAISAVPVPAASERVPLPFPDTEASMA